MSRKTGFDLYGKFSGDQLLWSKVVNAPDAQKVPPVCVLVGDLLCLGLTSQEVAAKPGALLVTSSKGRGLYVLGDVSPFKRAELAYICYRATRGGKTRDYRHDFDALPVVSRHRGGFVKISGGRFRFTARGIEG